MKKLLICASVAAMMAACSSDDEQLVVNPPVTEQGRTVTVTATLPTATRLALTEDTGSNTIKVEWTDEEEYKETFAVMTTAEALPAIFTQTEGNQFMGTLPESGPYYAYYPTYNSYYISAEESISATSVLYSLMSQSGWLDDTYTLMYAQSADGKTFSFQHLTAIVKFTLSGLESGSVVTYVNVSSTVSLPFAGTVDLTTGTLTAESGEQVLFMGLSGCTADEDGTCSFYAYLPPVAKDNVLTMTLTTSDGDSYATTVQFAKDIEAGKYYRAARTVTKHIEEHPAVDLGLSVKWASYNVGATAPEEYGDYYAWGGTETKDQYVIPDYTGTEPLEGENDVATVKWGDAWRMPTMQEWEELRTGCTWTWTTLNGVNGYQVTATNGNSIFLPAAGYCSSSLGGVGSLGDYWSATPYVEEAECAYRLFFDADDYFINSELGVNGFSIRPVCK